MRDKLDTWDFVLNCYRNPIPNFTFCFLALCRASENLDCYPNMGQTNICVTSLELAAGGMSSLIFLSKKFIETKKKFPLSKSKTILPILGPKIKCLASVY